MTVPFRVYVIGMPKTGTTSLEHALGRLGWNIGGYSFDHIWEGLEHGYPETLDARHDGLSDMAILPYWRQAARRHPTARFIATVRNERDWIASLEHWWKGCEQEHREHPRNLQWLALFGCARFNRQQALDRYWTHYEAIRQFDAEAGEGERVMWHYPCDGDGWDELCRWLGVEASDEPFPHVRPTL